MFHVEGMFVALIVGAAVLSGLVAVGYVVTASLREWRAERITQSQAGAAELARRMADPTRLAALAPEAPRREAARRTQPARGARRSLRGAAATHVHS